MIAILETSYRYLKNLLSEESSGVHAKRYDGNTILKMDTIVVPDSDETLELSEKSRSKMLLKEQDPLFVKHKVNTKPISLIFFITLTTYDLFRQLNVYSEHAYWESDFVPALDPSHLPQPS
ncbi:hypothetical protein Tco_0564523 [Tanacetum coccineum]